MSFPAKSEQSPGKRFKSALAQYKPLPILGTINAYSALLAEQAGTKAIYLSGGGVASATLGIPDLGITTCEDVVTEVTRITRVSTLPLLVDIDTGWGSVFNIARSVASIEKAGAAAIHLEDQVQAKRCGHRPNKALVTTQEMCDRIKACVDARMDPDFVIMARTDALASEGLEAAIKRAKDYVTAGADMIFAEACYTLEDYKAFTKSLNVPVLANITEFGKTPLFTQQELYDVGIKMVLYPLSAFRAMSHAALETYQVILNEGNQKSLLNKMQTRDELYQTLNYKAFEQVIDEMNKE